jgi:hypothetical protein
LESAAYSAIGEHLQKPHNAGSRREARFFNTLVKRICDAMSPPRARPAGKMSFPQRVERLTRAGLKSAVEPAA